MRKTKRAQCSTWPKSSSQRIDELLRSATQYLEHGDHQRARKILSAALVHDPDDAAILTRYADSLYQAEKVTDARDAYRRALAHDETQFQSWYGCGMAEFSLGSYARAIDCLTRALALEPKDADARFYLGKSLFQMGEVDAAIDELLVVAKTKDATIREQALRQIAIIIPGSPSRGNAEILQVRRTWALLAEKRERPRNHFVRKSPRARKMLRVGYVSSFFQDCNWMKPVWGVINRHDRSAFEVHLFADQGRPSAESGYESKPSDFIYDITELSNEEAAAQIFAAGIDVLVDLNGYSASERLGVFMRKPAPVVVGWFNMYATTGIRAFDYIIGDASVIPTREERYYSESVLRVSGSYLAFSVLYPVPPVAAAPCLRAGHITFGCLAPQYKITDEMIAIWSRILAGAPAAEVLLKSTRLDDSENRKAVHARFERHGIAPERVLLEGPAEHYEFLEAYERMDIALDTYPYNGGTTTMEALWQGVPVLAVDGDRWVSRTSKSILAAAGLGEWVQRSVEAHIQRAIELAVSAETPGQLADLRSQMRERLLASAACHSAGLCRELEGHYRHVATISDGQGRLRRSKPRSGRRNGPEN